MNDLTIITNTTLPTLIDRAAEALTSAKTSAEVLEARDMAQVAYDAAKSAGRMARAKKAHDDVIAAVYRAQAHALAIESRAKMRLADEYDAAEERGETSKWGGKKQDSSLESCHKVTPDDVGGAKVLHEARKLRDAEAAEPGKVERVLKDMAERGEEPTKAKLRREIEEPKAQQQPNEGDADAKERRSLAALTRAGLEDEVIGLRRENAELRQRVKKQAGEISDLKSANKDFTGESAEVIRRLQQEVRNAGNARWKAEETLTIWKRRAFALEKRVKELEGMEITL